MSDPFHVRGRAIVSAKGARRVRQGHPWIYRSDIESLPQGPAGVVSVVDVGGRELGTALYSPASTITLRLVAGPGQAFDRAASVSRVREAHARRERLMPGADAFRVVHGEADLLPGIFVDRYADCYAVQTTCAGAEVFEPIIVEAIADAWAPRAIVLRDDASGRAREGLTQHVTVVRGAAPVVARYHEGALELEVDLLGDQKTGSFLDQAQNHVLAGRYARGEGLDCFTYHGGFALQLAAGGCTRVTACDLSAAALDKARANAARAALGDVDFVQRDVFELLPELVAARRTFDIIVLDPPAFASTKHTVEKALRAYKEVNLRALKLLAPGGVLVSCSCSGRITPEAFDDMLVAAARDARRAVQLVERRGAGVDHPVLAGVPETEYLKCRVLVAL